MPSQRVLLTGACSLIGHHVLEQLMSRDVIVCAAARSTARAESLKLKYSEFLDSRLDVVVLDDPLNANSLKNGLSALSSQFEAVIHSPIYSPPEEHSDQCLEILKQTEKLNRTLLDFISDAAPKAHRVVIINTASKIAELAASTSQIPKIDSPMSRTGEGSEEETVLSVCWGGIKLLEDWSWDYMGTRSPQFDLVSLAGPVVYGSQLLQPNLSDDLEEGNSRIWRYVCNPKEKTIFQPDGLIHYADARDVAFAAVQALYVPSAGNRHFNVCAGTLTPRRMSSIISSRFPQIAERPPERELIQPNRSTSAQNYPSMFDSTETAIYLGLVKYTSGEETLESVVAQLLPTESSLEREATIT